MRVKIKSAANSDAGIGIGGVLQIVFIVLKLCSLIDWSWLWVLSPTWIGLGLVVLMIIVFTFIEWFLDKRGRYYL